MELEIHIHVCMILNIWTQQQILAFPAMSSCCAQVWKSAKRGKDALVTAQNWCCATFGWKSCRNCEDLQLGAELQACLSSVIWKQPARHFYRLWIRMWQKAFARIWVSLLPLYSLPWESCYRTNLRCHKYLLASPTGVHWTVFHNRTYENKGLATKHTYRFIFSTLRPVEPFHHCAGCDLFPLHAGDAE